MISDTIVYDILPFGDVILIKKSDGMNILRSLFISWPSNISSITLYKRISKTKVDGLKFIHTVNVGFLVSELIEEQFLYIMSSKNESFK